jgi:hypothetical protein
VAEPAAEGLAAEPEPQELKVRKKVSSTTIFFGMRNDKILTPQKFILRKSEKII